MESHCEILWGDNSGAYLGFHPTANYRAGLYEPENQAIICQQLLRYNILGLCIKNFLTTDVNLKLRYFGNSYTFNTQDDGAAIFFVIFKMVQPDTRAGLSDLKSNLDNMKMYQFKNDDPRANLHISEWMNDISIAG